MKIFTENELSSFNLRGDEHQALGNALIADSEPYFTMEKLETRSSLQGILQWLRASFFRWMLKLSRSCIQGNLMQAIGGSAVLKDTLTEKQSVESLYHLYGNRFKSSGITASDVRHHRASRRGRGKYQYSGSWLQAAGSIIGAVGSTIDYLDETG